MIGFLLALIGDFVADITPPAPSKEKYSGAYWHSDLCEYGDMTQAEHDQAGGMWAVDLRDVDNYEVRSK